ncbi:cornifelin homolog B-like isoform X1 [Cyclopterus lumpus]|uniref:Plac8 onzin related protein 2 n=1 Tax=Cyclopterus lumpus TaxID=8103 RepID=A0A8C2X593_CYCLU|nr:cornifelin homolog B-like isoform X1 [Cyclopterus lumpus]XP_034407007.1 cornifelin homolog B-like isoform X1 [Cyclopterus lumpus]
MSMKVWTQPPAVRVSCEDDEWTSGICECCLEMNDCCYGFWCCPCFACRTSRLLGHSLCLPLLDVCGCIRPISTAMRVHVRQRYGIRGSLCTDCLSSSFCPSCVWCQMSREMKYRTLPTTLGDILRRDDDIIRRDDDIIRR